MLARRRLSRLARRARARTLRAYGIAAGFLPHGFHVRSTSAPEGAYGVRFADGGGLPPADAYRVRRPAPAVSPAEPLAAERPAVLAFRLARAAGAVS